MTADFPLSSSAWSFGLAFAVFLAFAGKVILSWRRSARAIVLLCALLASAMWSLAIWVALVVGAGAGWWFAYVFDALRVGAWAGFLLLLLAGRDEALGNGFVNVRFLRYLALPIFLLLAMPRAGLEPWSIASSKGSPLPANYYAWLAAAIFGLVLAERLYRLTPANQRWAIKPLVIGLGGMFAFDVVLFSVAILFHRLDPTIWSARGLANAVVVGFVAIANARNRSWTLDLHVSRGVVYQSTALLLTGGYLVLVASAAYWVHLYGGNWAGTLKVALVFSALLALVVLVLSGSMRSRLRVLINKHLFSYRYDYRQEWLKFTRLLGTSEPGENLYHQVVRALADLVESTGGAIWLERRGAFVQVANLNLGHVTEKEPVAESFGSFLARTEWVIHLGDVEKSSANYSGLTIPPWLRALEGAWLLVPLVNQSELIGFVVLARPRAPIELNWEVRDLLKTASRQASSYLAQVLAKKALMEVEQFDSFNRLSAFVVHDLKNLVAQLALVVKNAERHRDNPEFQKDMLETVDHAVGRMNQLMLQLRIGTVPIEKPRPIDLDSVLQRIVSTKKIQGSMIDLLPGDIPRVMAHEDRIERVIGHIVQNAIDATEAMKCPNGRVAIRVNRHSNRVVVGIVDQGIGMTEDFMENRLFRPFQTTKSQGMGIGMYESMQYITGIGGCIEVNSVLGAGTRFDIFLPLVGDAIEVKSTERIEQ